MKVKRPSLTERLSSLLNRTPSPKGKHSGATVVAVPAKSYIGSLPKLIATKISSCYSKTVAFGECVYNSRPVAFGRHVYNVAPQHVRGYASHVYKVAAKTVYYSAHLAVVGITVGALALCFQSSVFDQKGNYIPMKDRSPSTIEALASNLLNLASIPLYYATSAILQWPIITAAGLALHYKFYGDNLPEKNKTP